MAGNSRKKRYVKSDWDSTVSDLSVHRLSANQLERRRSGYVSKNLEAARKDLYERPKVKSRRNSGNSSCHELVSTSSDEQLMRAKCSRGQPNITPAPHLIANKENLEWTLQQLTLNETPSAMSSPGGIRDDSLLRLRSPPTVLNDLPSDKCVDGDDPAYQPLINLTHYQNYVEQESNRTTPTKDKGGSVATMLQQLKQELQEYEKEVGGVDHTPQQGAGLEYTLLVLVRYLKKAQQQLKEERTLQEQLLLTVEEQQSILDTMATDILELKAKQTELLTENEKLKTNYKNMEDQLKEIKRGSLVMSQQPPQFSPIFVPHPSMGTYPYPPYPNMGASPIPPHPPIGASLLLRPPTATSPPASTSPHPPRGTSPSSPRPPVTGTPTAQDKC